MFQLPAGEFPRRRLRGWSLSVALHLAALVALAGQPWLAAFLASLSHPVQPPLPAATRLTILAPPPGKPLTGSARSFRNTVPEQVKTGAPLKIADSTDIAFDADDAHQLLPVLAANSGLIVFVPVLDRAHPRAAFRPDGSQAPTPATLDHWVRIRLANTSWWPEVDRLCSMANADGALEAMAVFPPSYRSALGAAIQQRVSELKASGRVVVGVALRLESGRPAGVVVRAITFAQTG